MGRLLRLTMREIYCSCLEQRYSWAHSPCLFLSSPVNPSVPDNTPSIACFIRPLFSFLAPYAMISQQSAFSRRLHAFSKVLFFLSLTLLLTLSLLSVFVKLIRIQLFKLLLVLTTSFLSLSFVLLLQFEVLEPFSL